LGVCSFRAHHTDAVGRYPEATRPQKKNIEGSHFSLTGTRSFGSIDRCDPDGEGLERVVLAVNDRIKRINCWMDTSFMLDSRCHSGYGKWVVERVSLENMLQDDQGRRMQPGTNAKRISLAWPRHLALPIISQSGKLPWYGVVTRQVSYEPLHDRRTSRTWRRLT
jgi:hypothetical protein